MQRSDFHPDRCIMIPGFFLTVCLQISFSSIMRNPFFKNFPPVRLENFLPRGSFVVMLL